MASKKSPGKRPQKSATKASSSRKASSGFTAEERAAMRERVQELKAEARRGAADDKAGDEQAVLAKIATMAASDRALAERVHAIIMATAPDLAPRLWYGMPAYSRDGKVLCYFQDAHKFKSRYATLGFSDKAKLDDGAMWPVVFALKELTAAEDARIVALVKTALG